jgi:hypothetical protein
MRTRSGCAESSPGARRAGGVAAASYWIHEASIREMTQSPTVKLGELMGEWTSPQIKDPELRRKLTDYRAAASNPHSTPNTAASRTRRPR